MNDAQIAEKSKKWALSFARRLNLARHMIDELAQEAAIGILNAARGFDPSLSTFEQRAHTYASFMMSRHLKALGGVVRAPRDDYDAKPSSVALLTEKGTGTAGHYDDRTEEGHSFETAAFAEALNRADARTGLMIQAKMRGDTYEEIASGMGVSREYVRKRVLAFAEELRAA